MKRLQLVFEEYLEKTGRLKKVALGGPELRTISPADNQLLINRLEKESKLNLRILIAIISMFLVLFGIGVLLVFVYIRSPKILSIIFGGDFLALLAIIRGLQQTWREKTTLDILLAVLPNLSPQEVVKVIECLYHSNKHGGNLRA